MNIEIKHRFTGSIPFACDAESLKVAMRLAIEAKANLIGANLIGANLGGKRIVSVSGIGSSRRLTNYDCDNDRVWCGCFTGTLAQFAKKIEETHKKSPRHLADYRAAVAFFTVCKSQVTE